MSAATRVEYQVWFPSTVDGTEMNDSSHVLADREEARSYQGFIRSRGAPAERMRRTVTYGEWEIDPD